MRPSFHSRGVRSILPGVLSALVLITVGAEAQITTTKDEPPARRGSESYELHGVRVPDPYRWLERAGDERDAWARSQSERTEAAFADDPIVEALRRRMIELNHYARAPVPRTAGDRVLLWGRVPGQLYSEIRVGPAGEDGGTHLLVGPDAHPASPNDPVAVDTPVPSPDGSLALYGASSASMPPCLRVVDVESGHDFAEDSVPVSYWPWVVAWLADGSGFAYVQGSVVRVHRLGEEVVDDPVVFRSTDVPTPSLGVRADPEGGRLFVTAFHPFDETTRVFVGDADGSAPWSELAAGTKGAFQVVGAHGDRIFLYTTHEAPNGRVVAVDGADPGAPWTEVVPEQAEAVYDDNHPMRPTVGLFGGRLAVLYGHEGRLILRVFGLDGELVHELVHEELGFTESGLVGHPERALVRYDVQSTFDPGSAHEVDLRSGERRVVGRARVPFDPDDFTLYRRSFESHDGVEVPMFLAHRRDVEAKGGNAVLINNWSALGMVVRPLYLPELHAWIEAGGVLAVPALRGSGEYGQAWEAAGTGPNKVTAIDDFGAAARWLVEEGIAGEGRVGLLGASLGGAATAGVLVRHPDAFGAAVIQIPRVDLLAEPMWEQEYGDTRDEAEFKAMMEWMPLVNADEGVYPSVLVQVGSVDNTAPPFHGYKLAATLQAAQKGPAPIYLQVVWGVGHNQGNGIPHRCETLGLHFGFLARALGLQAP